VDYEQAGIGCFDLDNKVALYEKILLKDTEHLSWLFPIENVDITLEVRSKEDPMLLAKKLSKESFDFGFSAHDLRAIGCIGFFISMLAMCRPCIVICSVRRIPNYQELVKQDEIDPELESVIRRRRNYMREWEQEES